MEAWYYHCDICEGLIKCLWKIDEMSSQEKSPKVLQDLKTSSLLNMHIDRVSSLVSKVNWERELLVKRRTVVLVHFKCKVDAVCACVIKVCREEHRFDALQLKWNVRSWIPNEKWQPHPKQMEQQWNWTWIVEITLSRDYFKFGNLCHVNSTS